MSVIAQEGWADGDVRLQLPPALRASAHERLSLSSGTVAAEERTLLHGPFLRGARLPSPSWRPPTPDELDLLLPGTVPIACPVVELVTLPPEVLSVFRDAGLHDAWDLDEARELASSADVAGSTERVAELLRPHRSSQSPASLEQPLPRPAGLPGSTIDLDRGRRYAGLHVDSWDLLPPKLRGLSPGRLCINVGSQDRFFMFLPQSVAVLAAAHGTPPVEQLGPELELPPSEANRIARWHMRLNPTVPVLRLRVLPGEAYVAPTENLIHDGSTEGQTRLDWTVTWRGVWSFNSN